MSEQFLFTTAKPLDQDTLVWTNQGSTPTSPNYNVSNNSLTDSINETYVTAIEENDTTYLSVLEATNESTLEALHNLTLDNSKIILQENLDLNAVNNENGLLNDPEENQVVVFSIEGSDDLYGLQLVQDEEGNVQKCQFQFRTTEQGTLEAIPESIQLLPSDDDNQEQQIVLQSEEVESQDDLEDDQFEETEQHNQYDEENHQLEQYNEEIEESAHFDVSEHSSHYEEHTDFNMEQHAHEETEEHTDVTQLNESHLYSDENSELIRKVFVKGEPLIKSEQRIQHEEVYEHNQIQEYETEPDPEENVENTIDIKPAILQFKEEQFQEDSGDGLLRSCEREETVEISSIGNEETLVQEESALAESNVEQDENYETSQDSNNCGIMEIQHYEPNSDQNDFSEDDSGSDSHHEVSRFKRLFIEDKLGDENKIENLNQDAILQVSEINEQESDNEAYEITHGNHVTAEGELIESGHVYQEFSRVVPTLLQQQLTSQNSNNILKPTTTVSSDKVPVKSSKKPLLYYLLPHPEKENLNAVPINNCVNIYNNCIKSNPRSVLKPQTLELKLVANTNSVATQDNDSQRQFERMEKRFSRSKEAIQARLFNNFINKTTIPHAPVRQKRLPRKQEIKPVDTRREEEIIVQEVMVSANGFVESVEERLKAKDKLEVIGYIELVDSDDEKLKTTKSKKKSSKNSKEGVIEILSSDDEDADVQNSQPLKRGRGRPKKNSVGSVALKRDREKQNKESVNEDETSPSKKSRTESSENDSDGGKKEIVCPHCPKTFPSQNSLSTHIQHHNLENRLRRTRKSIFDFKHQCEECETTFKNVFLLSRHVCTKKKNFQCEICKKGFKDPTAMNIHLRIHNSSRELASSQQNLVPAKKVEKNDVSSQKKPFSAKEEKREVPEAKKYNCNKCQASFKNTILLKRHVCQEKSSGKYKCPVCKTSFEDLIMFNIHKRKHMKENLVKTTVAQDKHISPKKMLPPKSRQSLAGAKIPNKGSPLFNVMKKFSCNTCGVKFASRLLLDLHTRRNCVKTPTKNTSQRMSLSRKSILPNISISTTVSTPLDMNAECTECSATFKTYSALLKHQIKVHNYALPGKDTIMKPKKKLISQIKDHGGIPMNPRLQKTFGDLKTKLITPRKVNSAMEITDEKQCS